jgi:hypothetical protein
MAFHGQRSPALLGDLRHQARHGVLLWALALLLFAQALIPIQSHTRWALTDDGQVIELCTLHGTVAVDETGKLVSDSDQQDQDRSPAMAFSHLLASALTGQAVTQPTWLGLIVRETPPAVIGIPTQRSLRHTPIRAPPVLS